MSVEIFMNVFSRNYSETTWKILTGNTPIQEIQEGEK